MNYESLLEEAAKDVDEDRVEQAYKKAEKLASLNPEDPRVAFIIAHCHLKCNRPHTSYYIYRYCQKFPKTKQETIWNQIGMSLAEMGREDEAEKWYLKAIDREPDPVACSSLASIYAKKGDPKRAVEYAEKALALDPGCKEAKWNAALALLKLHDWERGWDWYDTMLGEKRLRPHPKWLPLHIPVWEGNGGNVVVVAEQGLGDEIMFASMMDEVIERADKVVWAVAPRLVNLFQRNFPKAVVTQRGGEQLITPEPIKITHRISMGSLGGLFRTSDDQFPGTPYLKPCPDRAKMWRGLFDSMPGQKVGVMWRGGVGGLDEHLRTLELSEMGELLNRDVNWISLNHLKDAGEQCERHYNQTGVKIHHYPFVHSNDYDDTVALISQLDAVVTITATVAHVAGALGIPVHVLTPQKCQWRYGAEGNTVPWYKSMTLYRQTDEWPLKEIPVGLGG